VAEEEWQHSLIVQAQQGGGHRVSQTLVSRGQ
jgi:hypothetical protein